MRKKIGLNKTKRLTELRGDKKKTFKVMLPLQHSPPPVILCKMMDSARARSSGESTASQVLQDSRSHRLAPTGVWISNINPPGWKGNIKASQCLWRQHEWPEKGTKRGKRGAGILARLAWHADDPNNIKNLRFWYKCVSRWFWDFPGAIGELYPCPVYALITSARSGRKAHLQPQPETQLTQQIRLF